MPSAARERELERIEKLHNLVGCTWEEANAIEREMSMRYNDTKSIYGAVISDLDAWRKALVK